MSKQFEKLQNALQCVHAQTDFVPRVALVLGSGLGRFVDHMEVQACVPYTDITGFPQSTVSGHAGQYVFGWVGKVPVVVMQGRVHYYEGYTMSELVMPTRLMGLMGAKTLFLTNAAGGVNLEYQPGDLMLLRDHISSFVPSPLRGENADDLGTRFPDMSQVYDEALRAQIKLCAEGLGIPLREGVYLQTTGPQYETPAEIRMFRLLGADAVGMSTACEAIAARHMGLRVCGISCITNMAAGILKQPLNHAEVQETANRVGREFAALVKAGVEAMAE